jgi:ABC-type nitrate/sulfonate/bicarbonate transport system substrate-binding protein
MTPALSTAALLSRAVDYTTVPSTVATAAARGAPMKVIAFTSVKLQHILMSRSEFKSVTDLAGKRVGASGFGNLPAYEIQILIDRYRLGSNTTIVPVASSLDRLIAMQRGTIDAAIVAAPLDIKAEEMGLKRLMHMGTILQIPQAGLTATEEKLKKNRREVIEVMKATIEGLDYTSAQHNNVVEIIAKWVQLSQPQAAKAYDSVKDTFSRNGIPTDEQSKAYIAMLTATANLGAEPAAASIFDFSVAVEATRELAGSR